MEDPQREGQESEDEDVGVEKHNFLVGRLQNGYAFELGLRDMRVRWLFPGECNLFTR